MEKDTNTPGRILRAIVVVTLLGIIVYQVYSGVVLRKIGIPGLFEIEFAARDAKDQPKDKPRTYTTADFTGHWVNKNSEAGVTRAEIQQRLDKLVVHMWGKCHPTDCDWGMEETAASSANDGSIQLVWNPGFSIRRQELRILDDGRLGVFSKTEFTDNSGRPSYESVDYLDRQ